MTSAVETVPKEVVNFVGSKFMKPVDKDISTITALLTKTLKEAIKKGIIESYPKGLSIENDIDVWQDSIHKDVLHINYFFYHSGQKFLVLAA